MRPRSRAHVIPKAVNLQTSLIKLQPPALGPAEATFFLIKPFSCSSRQYYYDAPTVKLHGGGVCEKVVDTLGRVCPRVPASKQDRGDRKMEAEDAAGANANEDYYEKQEDGKTAPEDGHEGNEDYYEKQEGGHEGNEDYYYDKQEEDGNKKAEQVIELVEEQKKRPLSQAS